MADTAAFAGKARWAASAALGSVVVWVLVRWWLAARLDRNGWVLPPELTPAIDPDTFVQRLVMGSVAVVVVFGVLWWLLRSRSPRTVSWTLWGLLGAWVTVWSWGAVSQWQNHANRLHLSPTQTETLRVVGMQMAKPTNRSLGGAKMYVDWPAQGLRPGRQRRAPRSGAGQCRPDAGGAAPARRPLPGRCNPARASCR